MNSSETNFTFCSGTDLSFLSLSEMQCALFGDISYNDLAGKVTDERWV